MIGDLHGAISLTTTVGNDSLTFNIASTSTSEYGTATINGRAYASGDTLVENVYGDDGRVVAQTDGFGNTSTFAWDTDAQTSTMTDPHGGTHVDNYRDFVLVAREDPLGNRVEFSYDDDLNLVAVTDAKGHTAEMVYDLAGNLLEIRAPKPLGYVRSWEYDDRNNVVAATDGRGNVTRYRYDGAANLVEIEHPDGAVESLERDPDTGAVVAVTDPLGHTTTLEYDDHGNLARTVVPASPSPRRLAAVEKPAANCGQENPGRRLCWRASFAASSSRVRATNATTAASRLRSASVRASVDRAGDALRDVKAATGRLPGVVDSLQGAVDNVKAITEDVQPLLRSVEGTLEDVDEIVTGAKQTFPISTFAAKGRAARAEERTAPVPRSLRRDDLVKE